MYSSFFLGYTDEIIEKLLKKQERKSYLNFSVLRDYYYTNTWRNNTSLVSFKYLIRKTVIQKVQVEKFVGI